MEDGPKEEELKYRIGKQGRLFPYGKRSLAPQSLALHLKYLPPNSRNRKFTTQRLISTKSSYAIGKPGTFLGRTTSRFGEIDGSSASTIHQELESVTQEEPRDIRAKARLHTSLKTPPALK